MPKLSIITINYNNLEGLQRTFESVFAQTYQDFEYIVIDGGSTDGSKEVIEQNQTKIDYWVSEKDRGIYHAMNKGIKAASGEYLLFLNSGDEVYDPSTIADIVPQLHTEDLLSGNIQFISATQKFMGFAKEQVSFIDMYRSTIWHPSTFIKRDAFKDDLYDENLKICSDWKWFIIAIFKNRKSYRKLQNVIATFYMDGISSNAKNQALIRKEKEDTFRQYFNFSAIDFIKMDEFLNARKELEKLRSLKNSRLLKLLYKLGIFKAYEFF